MSDEPRRRLRPRRRRTIIPMAQKLMTTLWSGRFDAAPDAAAFEWGSSFGFDRRLFEDDVTGSLAWAKALAHAGVLSRRRSRRDRRRASRHSRAGPSGSGASCDGADEDVHSFVERLLVERLGDAGKRLHTGRSRNEQVSLDLRLYLRRRIPALQARGRARLSARSRGQARAGRRCADAVLHAFPPGAAGAGRALPAGARRAASPRLRTARRRARGSQRAAARLRRHRRNELRRGRARRLPPTSDSIASSPTASTRRRIATSRRRSSTPAR